jgi:hypothetical protein
MLRRLLIAAASCGVAGAFAVPALAAPGPPPPVRPFQVHSVSTAHFVVHYNSDSTAPEYITQTQADDLAAMAERAYAVETGWGYAGPPDDGDAKTDIYVVDLSSYDGVAAFAIPDVGTVPASGSVDFAKSIIGGDWEQHTIAHELFHLIQFRYWFPATLAEHWLLEGSAEWAGYKVDGYAKVGGSTGPPDLSLDCYDSVPDYSKCSGDGYANGGYGRWSFYELMAQRYGNAFMLSVLQNAQTLNSALGGLTAAAAAQGGSLADAVNDWAVRQMTGGWGIPALDSESPATYGSAITTGATTGPIASQTLTVGHLAARIIKFTRGDGHGEHACFAATLTINVGLPANVPSRPYFYWSADKSLHALDVSGTTASLSVPWDTCTWATGSGYLVLPNDSSTVDGADFAVSGSLAVDQTKPATPGADPTPVAVTSPVVQVPTADIAPEIDVTGPFVLMVSAKTPTVRLIVQSNAEGSLHAQLGSLDLGSAKLRMGGNDVRFKLPKSAVSALRRSSASGTNVLTLTPLSTSGTVTGTPVTRRVKVAKK